MARLKKECLKCKEYFEELTVLKDSVSLVYAEITSGKITKPNTDPKLVITAYENYIGNIADSIAKDFKNRLSSLEQQRGFLIKATEALSEADWSSGITNKRKFIGRYNKLSEIPEDKKYDIFILNNKIMKIIYEELNRLNTDVLVR